MTTSVNYQCYGHTEQDFRATNKFRGRTLVRAILFALIGFTKLCCEEAESIDYKSGPISIYVFQRDSVYVQIELMETLRENDFLSFGSLALESPLN